MLLSFGFSVIFLNHRNTFSYNLNGYENKQTGYASLAKYVMSQRFEKFFLKRLTTTVSHRWYGDVVGITVL